MDQVVPWSAWWHLSALISRPAYGAARRWASRACCGGIAWRIGITWPIPLYDIEAMRRFIGIDLGREPAPDETRISRFRHLLEQHELGAAISPEINAHLADQGTTIFFGAVVDATIVDGPHSTKQRVGRA